MSCGIGVPFRVSAQPSVEERFFADCPQRPRLRVHREQSLLDAHAVLYTTANLMELEVIRAADWLIDLPLPGGPLRPLERTLTGIRSAYHRLGPSRPVLRIGELFDALQLRELSLGDATAGYGLASGGANPGSGTLVRVNKLVDWTQHVLGDLNGAGGRLILRRGRLLPCGFLGRLVDDAQTLLTRGVHFVHIALAKTLDATVTGLESGVEGVVNLGRAAPHRDATAFLRMPLGVYRAHELWLLEHRGQLYAGSPEELDGLTHERVFHPGRRGPQPWWNLERLHPLPATVVMVAPERLVRAAPDTLRAYVVPAEWALRSPPELP